MTSRLPRAAWLLFCAQTRSVALLVAGVLALSGIAFVNSVSPAAAAPISVTLRKDAPERVLVGEPITYSLTASNPVESDPAESEADMQYNLSFRDVLPAGVDYVSTTAPTGIGDPTQIAELDVDDNPTGRTILIWNNIADLPDGSDVTLTYTVQPDADTYPVGDDVDNEATTYVSNNERRTARFDSEGMYLPHPAISSASDAASTVISALDLEKSEPSSERELVRGVHDHSTVYSLKVINNGKANTNGVTVVDHLPAGLEFLGCGLVDNSQPGTEEYPGSGRLTTTPAVPGCLEASSVTTVDSGLPSGYPAGVYTRVEWQLPADLAADETYTINYRAGIALKENVMPDGSGFTATANLDNNTGASTRETSGEISYTNRATASGRYQGPNNDGDSDTEVSAADSVTVTSEDIAVAKSITGADEFTQGGEAEFNLLVRTSEYTDGSDIVSVDTLPDGLCPTDAPAATYTPAALAEATGEVRASRRQRSDRPGRLRGWVVRHHVQPD